MEVLVVGYHKQQPDHIWGFLVCSRSLLDDYYGNLNRAKRSIGVTGIEESDYRSAGHDQCRIQFDGLEQAHRMLDAEVVRQAAGLLLYRVMRKGATPYAKFHCTALADLMLTTPPSQ